MKKIKIVYKQSLSVFMVPASNQKKKKLVWVQTWENTGVIMHYWEATFTEIRALDTYSGVQKAMLFKNGGSGV